MDVSSATSSSPHPHHCHHIRLMVTRRDPGSGRPHKAMSWRRIRESTTPTAPHAEHGLDPGCTCSYGMVTTAEDSNEPSQ